MKKRMLVFAVVLFFWMSFHQNGLTLTFFARDYTQRSVAPDTFFWFDLWTLLPLFGTALGLYFLIRKSSKSIERIIGLGAAAILGYLAYLQDIEPAIYNRYLIKYSTYCDGDIMTAIKSGPKPKPNYPIIFKLPDI